MAVSLVTLGIEAIPLVHAFNAARRIKGLMNEGKSVGGLVAELNRVGETSPAGTPAVSYADAKELQDDLAAELRQHLHGMENQNPDMVWVREVLAQAPDTSTNWQLMKVLDPYDATIRNPDKEAEFAAFLYRRAAERRITPRRALQEYVSGATTPTMVKGSLQRSHLLKDPPFIDLGFDAGDPTEGSRICSTRG